MTLATVGLHSTHQPDLHPTSTKIAGLATDIAAFEKMLGSSMQEGSGEEVRLPGKTVSERSELASSR